jgi:hypothetical protein
MTDNTKQPTGSLQDDPQAREAIQKHINSQFTRIIRIGNMRFGEGQIQPPFTMAAGQMELPASSPLSLTEPIPLEQAQQTPSFKFNLPRWIPEGFVVDPVVGLSTLPSGTYVHLMWAHPDGRRFGLDIKQRTNDPNFFPAPIPVEPNSVMEVSLAGQPAALITHRKFFWENSGETFIADEPELIWQQTEFDYQLQAWKKSLTPDELVRIATSFL